ncbi:MAG: 16S rRNA (adenine(1518)-N(6)/adenine(1519)-N(6))-dimethyltransferase RsmA [Gammaproteobacteria bacterium]
MRAKKQFGQHFLTDAETIAKIMTAAKPQAGDKFVEIGPGRGALTSHILASGAHLTAVEIDSDCAVLLRRKFAGARLLSVVEDDILRWDFPPGRKRWIGNLPYNISSPLLLKLCGGAITDAHFMLQKEVAMRICAAVGGRDYGRLTISVRAIFAAEMLMEVAPGCFVPPPKVDSALVRLRPLEKPLSRPAGFDALLRAAFQSRRKTLRNALRHFVINWQSAGINPDLRPQNLSPQDYAKLAKHIAADGGDMLSCD